MTTKSELIDLEEKLSQLRAKKEQLDSEVMRHQIDISNAKTSLESSLSELKGLGFGSIKEAEDFLSESVVELKSLLTEAQTKIDGIVTE